MHMPHTPHELMSNFRSLYPEISDNEVPAAYESFRRYAQLATEIARRTFPEADLTDIGTGGTVSAGQVDPERTFTNTG
jgi:hypothetical protein